MRMQVLIFGEIRYFHLPECRHSFSVGFGDVAPVGIGRLLAIIEALLGYTIPAAFVVRTFIDFDPSSRK